MHIFFCSGWDSLFCNDTVYYKRQILAVDIRQPVSTTYSGIPCFCVLYPETKNTIIDTTSNFGFQVFRYDADRRENYPWVRLDYSHWEDRVFDMLRLNYDVDVDTPRLVILPSAESNRVWIYVEEDDIITIRLGNLLVCFIV